MRASRNTGPCSVMRRSEREWFYRVRARNAAGASAPSNVFGPVEVSQVTFVDELADFSKVHSRSGELEIKSRDCRAAMEDAHRAAGQAGSALVYRVASPIAKATSLRVLPEGRCRSEDQSIGGRPGVSARGGAANGLLSGLRAITVIGGGAIYEVTPRPGSRSLREESSSRARPRLGGWRFSTRRTRR